MTMRDETGTAMTEAAVPSVRNGSDVMIAEAGLRVPHAVGSLARGLVLRRRNGRAVQVIDPDRRPNAATRRAILDAWDEVRSAAAPATEGEIIAAVMALSSSMVRRELSDEEEDAMLTSYVTALGGLPMGAIAAGVEATLRGLHREARDRRFMPRPTELREIVIASAGGAIEALGALESVARALMIDDDPGRERESEDERRACVARLLGRNITPEVAADDR